MARRHPVSIAGVVVGIAVALATAPEATRAFALASKVVDVAGTPAGHGAWMVSDDGTVSAAGGAAFHGSMGGRQLNRPIVAIAAAPSGQGFAIAASDGGVFTFGDATFYGSTGNLKLNQPIVGITTTPTGRGYWLVAADGGIFGFGDATFYGSTGNLKLNQPIVGITRYATGYALAAADGAMHVFVETEAPARAAAELELFQRVNDERVARGLALLAWDPLLAATARTWSATMSAVGFAHSNLGRLLGPYGLVGENLAAGSAGVRAGSLHGALMGSDTHRAIILGTGWERVGVGIYCGPDRSIWITENFGRPAASGAAPPGQSLPSVAPLVRGDPGGFAC